MPFGLRDAADLAEQLPTRGLAMLSGCSAESPLLADAIIAAGASIADATFTGIFVPGYNRCRWLENPHAKLLSFFMTPEQRACAPGRVDFRPLRYADILRLLRTSRPQAVLCMVSPPDEDGMCSFGTTVDFIADLWRSVPVRIAHINPLMPPTRGDSGIPFSELTAWCEAPTPLLVQEEEVTDPAAQAIARHVEQLIPDRATIQIGLGKIPGSVLRALTSRRGLRIYSGLIGDAVLDLLEAGALAADTPIIAGVAIGTKRLYDAVSSEPFRFAPVSITHAMDAFVGREAAAAVNSALAVDLFGQGYAELTPKGLMSGPGGATDFAQSVRAYGGQRIVALPSTAGGGRISRIAPAGKGAGPVSLGRSEIDVVVTEHGAADLRGLDHDRRAAALVAISDPAHRESLERGWSEFRKCL